MYSSSLLNLYVRLLTYTGKRWKYLTLAITGMIIYSLTNAGLVALIKPLLDENLFQQSINETALWMTTSLIFAILLLRGVGNYLSVYYVGYVGSWVVKDLRAEMMRHLLRLPAAYFDTHEHGNILSRFTYDCEQIAALASKALMYVVRDSLTIIAILAWLFYLESLLSALILLIALPISYIMYRANTRFRKFAYKTQHLYGNVSTKVQQAIATNRIVKASNAQEYECNAFEDSNEDLRRKKMRTVQTRALSVPVIMILAGLSIIVVLYVVKAGSLVSTMSTGTIVSFIAAIMMLFRPLRNLASINAILQQGLAATDSVFRFLDEPLEADSGAQITHSFRGDIDFKHVFFRYLGSDSYALHDINLQIAAGETIALVGHSGTGKSSLVNLLPRLYHPVSGSIEIDGSDIASLKLHDLRSQIAYVSQQTELIRGTVAENISYGTSTPMDMIKAAAVRAHAWEFIEKLPQKFDTLITNDLLSGGQAQRIAIARALLKKTPIIIFDEATSALDTISEQQIKIALQENIGQHTILIIAHRFSTIDFVKKIIVLDQGRIADIGSHQDLLSRCTLYQHLYADTNGSCVD